MDNGVVLAQKNRIVEVDILRGFAIAAILLIHSSNHFLYGVFPSDEPLWLQEINQIVRKSLYFMFEGKSYALFAMLFGFSFALQCENQQRLGLDLSYRMVWRLIILMGWGVINGAFFAGGDPLLFYALSMLLIIPLRRVRSRWLVVIALLLSFQPLDLLDRLYCLNIGESYIGYYTQLFDFIDQDNFFVMAQASITLGLKGALMWAVETGRFTQTLALFIIGMLLYRVGFMGFSRGRLFKLFTIVFAMTVLFFIIGKYVDLQFSTMLYNLMFSSLITIGVLLLYRVSKGGVLWSWFCYLGKMSLTNFIGQSIICSFLYYPWGLNLAPKLGVTFSVLVALIVLIFQIVFSKIWLKYNRRGPLEQLWHKLTWI